MSIDIVDCQNGGILANGQKIYEGINKIGFVYLKNFGISPQQVASVFRTSNKFWFLPPEVKEKYNSKPREYETAGNSGYIAPNVEILHPTSAAELREAFNYRPVDYIKDDIADHAPQLLPTLREFYSRCFDVSLQILKVLAEGLDLPTDFFYKEHSITDTATTMRLLHYPPLPEHIPAGTVRLGEHSDYGIMTLLFQDDVGGLEICGNDGQFIPATPVPDAVLVNTGDLLQRWTSDRIRAVRHRVRIPNDHRLYSSDRYSIAFFVHPKHDTVVKPLDGSTTYEPVVAMDHLLKRYKETFY